MDNRSALRLFFSAIFIAAIFRVPFPIRAAAESGTLLTGKAAMGDWKSDAPGVRRKITVQDLPPPSSNILAINRARVLIVQPVVRFVCRPVLKSNWTAKVFA